jgi:Tfp pilus assembly protein PilE
MELFTNEPGYTLVEMIFVCAIVLVVALMGMGTQKSVKKYAVEKQCVTKLKQIAQLEESFRNIGDPSLNPDSSYGTFFELQNAGLIPASYTATDSIARDGQPYIPFYNVEIVKSPTASTEEPDRNQYFIKAWPIDNPYRLKIFLMLEDGEVYFLSEGIGGNARVWE